MFLKINTQVPATKFIHNESEFTTDPNFNNNNN